jgi:hypothetical protein
VLVTRKGQENWATPYCDDCTVIHEERADSVLLHSSALPQNDTLFSACPEHSTKLAVPRARRSSTSPMNTRRGGAYTPAAEPGKEAKNAPPPFLTKT